jgi:hypothetical protein
MTKAELVALDVKRYLTTTHGAVEVDAVATGHTVSVRLLANDGCRVSHDVTLSAYTAPLEVSRCSDLILDGVFEKLDRQRRVARVIVALGVAMAGFVGRAGTTARYLTTRQLDGILGRYAGFALTVELQ